MNLIQISNGMGNSMRFGDLPKYRHVINAINEILPEDQLISVTTTGTEFMTIYQGLKADKQNLLASVLDGDLELQLEIASDIAMTEASRRNREQVGYAQNARLILLIMSILLLLNLYSAYGYHQYAIKVIGPNYDSTFISAISKAVNIFHFFTDNSSE